MILNSFLAALAQITDPRFRAVLLKGLGLTVALLAGLSWLVAAGLGWLLPDTLYLPWVGEIDWIDDAVSWAAIPLMLVLSVFLMMPVASAFISLFLDEVADAVEERHYPGLPPATPLGLAEGLRDGLSAMGVLIAANILALITYLFLAPVAPIIFIALNGFLLGREYFQLVALRRLGRAGAKAARRRHAATIWAAGALMAAPLTLPVVNLFIPILGAATFTHLFHRLESRRQTA